MIFTRLFYKPQGMFKRIE